MKRQLKHFSKQTLFNSSTSYLQPTRDEPPQDRPKVKSSHSQSTRDESPQDRPEASGPSEKKLQH